MTNIWSASKDWHHGDRDSAALGLRQVGGERGQRCRALGGVSGVEYVGEHDVRPGILLSAYEL
jgi:hypothetical protein